MFNYYEGNKILIVGSNGMLGKDILNIFMNNEIYEVFSINRKLDYALDNNHSIICDVTNEKELNNILKSINPNIIINCAANVNVDDCEKNREKAYMLHVEASKNLASFNEGNTRYIYISTDSVFNGLEGNYTEKDKTNPLNYYALTKLKGEEKALACNKNTLVIRTNIYGFHNEVSNSLVEWAISCLNNKQPIGGFNDVLFNPVYTKQLARAIYQLTNINYYGILNVGSNDFLSKYDFLLKLAYEFDLDSTLINAISVDNIKFNASRPKNTTLNLNKLGQILSYEIKLNEGLKELHLDLSNKRRGLDI